MKFRKITAFFTSIIMTASFGTAAASAAGSEKASQNSDIFSGLFDLFGGGTGNSYDEYKDVFGDPLDMSFDSDLFNELFGNDMKRDFNDFLTGNHPYINLSDLDGIDFSSASDMNALSSLPEIVFSKDFSGTDLDIDMNSINALYGTDLDIDTKSILSYMTQLTAYSVDPENADFVSADGVLYSKDMTTLISYPDNKTDSVYTVPDTVTTISDFAFDNVKNLKNIILPENLKEIGEGAFYNSSVTEISIPDDIVKISENAFRNSSSLTSVILGQGVKALGDNAFNGCINIISAKLPEGLKVIGENAFSGNINLSDLALPDSIENIKEGAFSSCMELSSELKELIKEHTNIIYGDLDCNNVADLTDLTYLSLYLMHSFELNSIQKIAADIVDDDLVDIADLAVMKQYIMGDSVALGPVF